MRLNTLRRFFFDRSPILFFAVGIYFCVILPFGPGFTNVLGDLGDARLNNYILEHFHRWLTGADASYWSAPFFYPFPYTIAFSENLLGSAPIYTLFRIAGWSEALAFQGWFIVGYALNFIASAWVLSRLGVNPVSVGAGAFLFTFSLPILAQENHAQLLYRCFVPIACHYLWGVYRSPRLSNLMIFLGAIIAQFYFCIYIGFFLTILSLALTLSILLMESRRGSLKTLIVGFREGIPGDWLNFSGLQKALFTTCLLALLIGFVFLLHPYYLVSRIYGFARSWHEVALFLPRPESFLVADRSGLWSFLGDGFSSIPRRDEQQLFPGGAVAFLLILALVVRFRTAMHEPKFPVLSLLAAGALFILVLDVNDFSLYRFVYDLPGFNAIRAVARLEMVLVWPIAIYSAWVLDSLIEHPGKYGLIARFASLLLVSLMVAESIFYDHVTYSIVVSEARLEELKNRIDSQETDSPVLFLAGIPEEDTWMTEIDAMIVARDLGWATFNGYTGNTPPDYEPAQTCKKLRRRIQSYMAFKGINEDQFLFDLMDRTVVIGFEDCNSN